MLSLPKAGDNDSLLDLLEQEGGDPNVTEDPVGHTCLMAAASAGHLHTVELLVSKESDVNQTCTHGRTALFCAASKGHAQIVRHLVDHGAHVQLPHMVTWGLFALFFRHMHQSILLRNMVRHLYSVLPRTAIMKLFRN